MGLAPVKSLHAPAALLPDGWQSGVALAIADDGRIERVERRAPAAGDERLAGPVILGLGLAILWIVGMSAGQPAWANWLNFLFALAFLGVAVAAALQPRMVHVRH